MSRATTPTFLGDELGPRARRRARVLSVATLVVLAALVAVAVRRFSDRGQLESDLWSPLSRWSVLRFLLGGFVNTLKAAAVAMVLATVVGIVMALGRLARNRPVRWVAGAYVDFFRAVPLILLILFSLLGLPEQGLHPSPFQALVLSLTIYNGAVLGEIFRAGILSLDRGQSEAASAIGLTYWQSMGAVILPQAARRMAPAIVSQLITLLKDTALGFVVGYDDALRRAGQTGTFFNNVLQCTILVALLYIAINFALSRLAHRLEVRQQRRLGAGRIDVSGVEDLAVIGAAATAKA